MKKIFNLIIIFTISIFLTGCLKNDTMEDITIYTTVYPIEYITDRLYSDYSTINSIYPDGVNVNEYTLTSKQLKDYSDSELLIFNGLNEEKEYVTKFFKNNKNIKIVDATNSMEMDYRMEELWLNPSNFLMIAQNIKNGLFEYLTNNYIKNTIEKNYKELKMEVSKLDASLTNITENTNNKTIIIADDSLNFLEKYGFNIISIDKNSSTDKKIADAKELLSNNTCSCIFALNNDEIEDYIKEILENDNVKITYLHNLSNITEEERYNKENYLTIMSDNIELIRTELYK